MPSVGEWSRALAKVAVVAATCVAGLYANFGVMVASGRLAPGWVVALALAVSVWFARRVTWLNAALVGLTAGSLASCLLLTSLSDVSAKIG